MSPRSRLVGCVVLLLLAVSPTIWAQTRCPRGMVWGGHKCEWRDLCPDGRPPRGGVCRPPDESPKVNREPKDRVRRPSPPKIAPDPRPIPEVKAPRPCETSTIFHPVQDQKPKQKRGMFGKLVQPRRVVVVGGNASGLFTRYVADAEKSGRSLDFQELEVVYFDEQDRRQMLVGGDNVRQSVGQLLAGLTWKQVWLSKLQDIVASPRSDAEAQAEMLEADLLCGLGSGD